MAKNKKLTELAGSDTPEPVTIEPAGAEPQSSGPVYVVRKTYADPGDRHEHTGPSVMQTATGFVSVLPGLNILDEGTELDIAELEGFSETDEHLTGFTGTGSMRELAEKSEQPRALEHMLKLESAKPFTGNRRRDPELLALLKKRLAFAGNVRHLEVGDLAEQSRAQSMIAQSRAV